MHTHTWEAGIRELKEHLNKTKLNNARKQENKDKNKLKWTKKDKVATKGLNKVQ